MRVLALLGTIATVLVGAALMLSAAVDGPSGGSLILIVVGAATIAGGGWFCLRLSRLGIAVHGSTLCVRSFTATTRIPVSEIRSVSLRTTRGRQAEWMGYLETLDGSGMWLWATEAGPARRPPRRSATSQLRALCATLGITYTGPASD